MEDKIKNYLLSTERPGMEQLIEHMETNGFFESSCSGGNHLAEEGGLAEHSLNVLDVALSMNGFLQADIPAESIIICSLLHDIGKMGQFGKRGYVPNMVKVRAAKANPNPELVQSDKKPYKVNPELLPVDHECRALPIIAKYVDLTEEEQQAILWHNGLYGVFYRQIQGRETPLYMLIHFADMWASRVLETGDEVEIE